MAQLQHTQADIPDFSGLWEPAHPLGRGCARKEPGHAVPAARFSPAPHAPPPRQILHTPRAIVILYEANFNVRQILTDGRPQPNNDSSPWWYGYSVGHWDGDTLVGETTGFRDDVWLDVEGSLWPAPGKRQSAGVDRSWMDGDQHHNRRPQGLYQAAHYVGKGEAK